MLTSIKNYLLYGVAAAAFGCCSPARAIEPEVIQTLANGTTLCIVQANMADSQLPPLEPLAPLEAPLNSLREAVGGQIIYIAFDLPYGASVNTARFMTASQGLDQAKLQKFLERLGLSEKFSKPEVRGKWTIISLLDPANDKAEPVLDSKVVAADVEQWTEALQDSDKFPVHITFRPPSYLRRVYEELQPELPQELGGGSSQAWVEGLHWLHFGINPQSLHSSLRIQSATPQAATQLSRQISRLLPRLLEKLMADADPSALAIGKAMLGLLPLQVEGSQVVWEFDEAESTEQFLSLAQLVFRATTEPLAVNQSVNNMKQLLLSMHNYVDAYQSFPPAAEVRGPDGRSGLSWRVHLLPFINEADLFKQFKLDEAWDSPHNMQLLSRMPSIFAPPTALGQTNRAKPFHTVYAAPVGKKTIFGGDKPATFSNITDGTSNTVALVELAPEHAIPWTAPDDYVFDPDNPPAKLNSVGGLALVAYADGSVRRHKLDNTPEVWNAIFSASGGELVEAK